MKTPIFYYGDRIERAENFTSKST